MRTQGSILALCLLGSGLAVGQTTTGSTSYTSTTTTNNSSYSTAPSSTTSGTMNNSMSTDPSSTSGTMNSTTSPTTTSGSYNSNATPSGNMNSNSTYSTTTTTGAYNTNDVNRTNEKRDRPYKAFTGGFYAGLNTTRYRGEDVDGNNLSGRLGYQLGVFARGGGRLYGQVGVEYFASSSNFFRPGDGQSVQDISGRIDTKWLQIPVMVGVKLLESERGISAVRLGVGAEYANRLSTSNTVQINNSEIRSGTFLGLANLGFDIGPLLIDIVYHHGFSDAVRGFNDSQRRSLGLNVGFKF